MTFHTENAVCLHIKEIASAYPTLCMEMESAAKESLPGQAQIFLVGATDFVVGITGHRMHRIRPCAVLYRLHKKRSGTLPIAMHVMSV